MTLEQTLKLIDAGFTRDEIRAMDTTEPPKEDPKEPEKEEPKEEPKKEEPKEEPKKEEPKEEPEEPEFLKDIKKELESLKGLIQKTNINTRTIDSNGGTQTQSVETILGAFIRPPMKKKEEK